jgi:glycosyltransferase involved in cell wall biosynthesis
MHWIGVVESPGHVCCRYRLAALAPYFRRAGHSLELRSLPKGAWARLRFFRGLREANVILQRRLLPGWQFARLRRAARHLVFDVDDAIFLRDSYSPRGLHAPYRLRRFATTVRACEAVAAGNAFLHAESVHWGATAHVVPTCIDFRRYPLAAHTRAGAVQLVWIGSSSTLQGLEVCTPLLEELGRRVPDLQLKLICDRFLHWRHLPVLRCPWTEEGEAAALAEADIGVSWMPDDLWSRGKCGLKVLQYMAAGLPVVANPVGIHRELVRHGETGFLAETAAQWVDAVGRLAQDRALRRRMGRAGRRLVEDGFSIEAGARRLLLLLESVSERSVPEVGAAPSGGLLPQGRVGVPACADLPAQDRRKAERQPTAARTG